MPVPQPEKRSADPAMGPVTGWGFKSETKPEPEAQDGPHGTWKERSAEPALDSPKGGWGVKAEPEDKDLPRGNWKERSIEPIGGPTCFEEEEGKGAEGEEMPRGW